VFNSEVVGRDDRSEGIHHYSGDKINGYQSIYRILNLRKQPHTRENHEPHKTVVADLNAQVFHFASGSAMISGFKALDLNNPTSEIVLRVNLSFLKMSHPDQRLTLDKCDRGLAVGFPGQTCDICIFCCQCDSYQIVTLYFDQFRILSTFVPSILNCRRLSRFVRILSTN
jgi:hypothetical protein